MSSSLGFIEVSGVTAAVTALDIMCKTADVSFVAWERKMGGRLVTIIIEGSVSSVTQAVESAADRVPPIAKNVIANPHEETVKMAALSASRTTRGI